MANACIDCGIKVSPRKGVLRCKRCWGLSRRGVRRIPTHRCADCDKELNARSRAARRKGGRCWDCYLRALDARPKRPCTTPGCKRPHEAKGLCHNHYRASLTKRQGGPGGKPKVHRYASAQACQICGYNRMPSQVNRIDATKGYVSGNVTAVCSRCHGEVTAGLIPHPAPLLIPWL